MRLSERTERWNFTGDRLDHRTPSNQVWPIAAMSESLEATRDLSTPDLLRVLNEKLDLGDGGARGFRPLPIGCATSLESYVGISSSYNLDLNKCGNGVLRSIV